MWLFTLWSPLICHWRGPSCFLKSAGSFWEGELSWWREKLFLCIMCTHQSVSALNWSCMMYDLASSRALCFITSCVIVTPIFVFKPTDWTISCSNSGKWPYLASHFQVECLFINFCVCCLVLQMFVCNAQYSSAASQLFILLAWLNSVSLKLAP